MVFFITSDGLSNVLCRPDDIENVVRDLKGKPELLRVGRKCRKLCLGRPTEDCAAAQRCAKERPRFAHVDTAHLLHRNAMLLCAQVEHLSTHHALSTGSTTDLIHHAQKCIGGYILLAQDDRKRER